VNRRLLAPAGLLVLTGLAQMAVLVGIHGPARVAAVFAFLLLAPGWPMVSIADPPLGLLARLGLAIALSISLDMLAATGLLYLRLWSAELAVVVMAFVVVVGVIIDLPPTRTVLLRRASSVWSALGTERRT